MRYCNKSCITSSKSRSSSGGVIVSELNQQIFTSKFESHQMPHSCSFEPHLSKKFNKFQASNKNSITYHDQHDDVNSKDLLFLKTQRNQTKQNMRINFYLLRTFLSSSWQFLCCFFFHDILGPVAQRIEVLSIPIRGRGKSPEEGQM